MWSHNDPSYGGAEYHNFDGGGFGNLQIWCTEFQHGGSFAIHADAHSSPLGPITGSFNTAGNSQIFAIMRRTEWAYDSSSPNVPPAGWLFTEGFVGKASANVWLSGIGHATASVDINSTLPLDTGYSVYPNAYVNVYQGSDADPEELIGFKSQTQAVSLGDSDVIGYFIAISGNAEASFMARDGGANGSASSEAHFQLDSATVWHEHVHSYY